MLQQHYRLSARTRLHNPRTYRTQHYLLKIAANGLAESRYGFVVRKSIDKRAVIRNRIRRVLRSCVEELREQIAPGYDMLFLLQKDIVEKPREELLQELKKLFEEKGLIKT